MNDPTASSQGDRGGQGDDFYSLIIDPREPEPFAYEREHVILLSDWTDEKPERVFAKLKKQSDYYNFHKRTAGDLENDEGRFHVRKHTLDMPPGTKRSYRVRADALGRWAYHCHLLFHMEAGMFREVRVEE